MNTKQFLITHSVIYAFFAVALFFLPDLLWPFYGVQINDQYARFLSQHNSIFLGGIAVLIFLFRDLQANSESMRNLLKGLFITNLLGCIITLYACLKTIFFGLGWSDPIFFGVLAILCVLQLKKNTTMV